MHLEMRRASQFGPISASPLPLFATQDIGARGGCEPSEPRSHPQIQGPPPFHPREQGTGHVGPLVECTLFGDREACSTQTHSSYATT